MNLPNKLAVLRIILVIPFVLLLGFGLTIEGIGGFILRVLAFWIFVGASFTDYLDGYIARRDNLVTNLGKLLDPLADKILVLSALLVFTKNNQLSIWVVLLILFRELMITGLRSIAAAEGVVIAAETLGKWKTVSQIIGILIIIVFPFGNIFGTLVMLIPLILTMLSGYEYFVKCKDLLSK
ncbi:MAG: CDP-diacylglycerol--glycerol-3-phosphate 3-phosphatidyltransferase [Sebaldella sp.]|nr:CDP-diacylglycerol--glycerol-3-phosphate 3-phosphatidyltransferase [Sebaldella sp.]